MAEKLYDDWKVVPFNINMEPAEDPDARALILANKERQLEAMPLRQRSSAQPYHAQPVLTAPPQPLLLKGSSSKTKTTIKVPTDTRILPPTQWEGRWSQDQPERRDQQYSLHYGGGKALLRRD